jgi:hypothetical protein
VPQTRTTPRHLVAHPTAPHAHTGGGARRASKRRRALNHIDGVARRATDLHTPRTPDTPTARALRT